MKLIKEYLCDGSTPCDEELLEGLDIVSKEDCIVRLKWFFPYSGWYDLTLKRGMTFEECKSKLPNFYGV